MTDDAALIARLQTHAETVHDSDAWDLIHEAADRIAAQAEEIARLTRERDAWRFDNMNMTDEACRDGEALAKAEAERDARPAREPTPEMLAAAADYLPGKFGMMQWASIWRLMYDCAIDAARREPKP